MTTADQDRPPRRVLRAVLVVAAVVVTLALYAMALVATGFLACGVSGCSGGGFGPAFSPTEAQVGLVVSGLVLVPLVVWLLRGHGLLVRLGAGVGTVVLGVLLAMALLDLGPDGCPFRQERATAGPEAFEPGSATCSGDRDALPRR